MVDKIEMSLDDIIKQNKGGAKSRGGMRRGRGVGSAPRRGAVRGGQRPSGGVMRGRNRGGIARTSVPYVRVSSPMSKNPVFIDMFHIRYRFFVTPKISDTPTLAVIFHASLCIFDPKTKICRCFFQNFLEILKKVIYSFLMVFPILHLIVYF